MQFAQKPTFLNSVKDQGGLSRIPEPDPKSFSFRIPIPDHTIHTVVRGVKNKPTFFLQDQVITVVNFHTPKGD
jgi:hypothetical protein